MENHNFYILLLDSGTGQLGMNFAEYKSYYSEGLKLGVMAVIFPEDWRSYGSHLLEAQLGASLKRFHF